jgi:hypothetical protein
LLITCSAAAIRGQVQRVKLTPVKVALSENSSRYLRHGSQWKETLSFNGESANPLMIQYLA